MYQVRLVINQAENHYTAHWIEASRRPAAKPGARYVVGWLLGPNEAREN